MGTLFPTCLASSVPLVFLAAAQFGWDVAQFDVVKAYMLAAPSHMYYVRYPPGFGEYLARSEDAEQFNASAFLLRADKNCTARQTRDRCGTTLLPGIFERRSRSKSRRSIDAYSCATNTREASGRRVRLSCMSMINSCSTQRRSYPRSPRRFARALPAHRQRIGLPGHHI